MIDKNAVALATLCLCASAGASAAADTNDGVAIGIDLGTTYSATGVYANGVLNIITNSRGNRITPSYVAFNPETGERLIGDAAKNQMTSNPANTIFDVKRLIGRRFDEIGDDVKNNVPFKLINRNNQPLIEVTTGPNGKIEHFTPEQISAMVLGHMRDIAQDHLGHPITKAVVTVPAYFNDAQRQATRDAGVIAGLDVIRIINEPTAAAIAYGMSQRSSQEWQTEKNVLVFDLGGGTFDVSALTIDAGVFEVLATGGDTRLGGENFDERLMAHFVELIKSKHARDISTDQRALAKLRRECEKAKRALSSTMTTRLQIEQLIDGLDLNEQLTRAKFEQLNHDLFKQTIEVVKKTVADSGLAMSEFDEIVIVGGSTRIPKVQTMLKQFFNGKELAKGINPDEAVAHGAGIHAAVLTGNYDQQDIVVIDATPLSIGIATVGDIFQKIVPRNSPIPIKRNQIFSTASDNQQAVTIVIYEGERTEVRHNHLLGKFTLDGIRPAPRGQPQIDVELGIDANGILTVSAKDLETDKQQQITIDAKSSGRLNQDEIDRMIQDGLDFEKQDQELRNRTESFLAFERSVYDTKHKLTELSSDDVIAVEELNNAIEEALLWLDNNQQMSLSLAEIKDAHETFDTVLSNTGHIFNQKPKEEL